jgi:RNA polymerase sigma-70 factor (ECF subfamily)
LIDNQEMLYKLAWKYLSNHEDVLDAIQETAYKALKNSSKLRKIEYALTWVVRILINNCLQTLSERKKFVKIELNENFTSKESNFTEKLELNEALLGMSKKYRDVVVMKYIEGYKIKEIAVIYNKSENTIKTWLKRGLESSRSEVSRYDI